MYYIFVINIFVLVNQTFFFIYICYDKGFLEVPICEVIKNNDGNMTFSNI